MAFEYGESYFGLRTFGSSVGDVKDASATVTATSSIANVGYVVAIGASASLTVTSSTTCAGESVVIEESDTFSYGAGLYGYNAYTQADLQTVVTATSSTSASCERVRLAEGLVSSNSGVASIGGFTANTDAYITANSSTTISGQKVGERSAYVVQYSTTTCTATATFNEPVQIVATSSSTASAEKFFLESSDKFSYGSGLYGYNVFDAADLQTVVSVTSVDTTCTGAKVNLASATVSVASSASISAVRIEQPSATITVTSSTTSAGLVVYRGIGAMTTNSTTTQTTDNTRIRESSSIVSSTSGVATIGREKWEIIVNNSNTWTQIAA